VLDGVSLTVGHGEIVGIGGAMGSGRSALLSAIGGVARTEVLGAIELEGVPVRSRSPREALRHGIMLVPEDRKGQGLVLGMSVADNLALPVDGRGKARETLWSRLGFYDPLSEEARAAHLASRLRLRASASAPCSALSGGNQQKVALGKWLERRPRLLLLDEPTRGVDVGAREEIYAMVEGLARQGTTVLFASSDLQELCRLAQRVVVLRKGRVCGTLAGPEIQQAAIVALATGVAKQEDQL
jgi:ABC-type sugar transport system ATPase subunit